MLIRQVLTLLLIQLLIGFGRASLSCTTDEECEAALLKGSKCVDNVCSNPFHEGGCLQSFLPGWDKVRVCNSEDPPEAAEMGFCRIAPVHYTEVRILSLNWESALLQAWILQILLSEILSIPVSIETGYADSSLSLYDANSTFFFGQNDIGFKELEVSSEVLDCRHVLTDDQNEYTPCAHYVPEVWETETLVDSIADGTGPFIDLGVLGEQHWYIPRFTAEKDPSLLSYFGLRGEENRQKLAETFKRPTTWKDYCKDVSSNGCASDDGVAARPPSAEEELMMFSEGSYTGHFRATDANNCTALPTSCTGHFADYPCEWETYAPQLQYHLDIALESNGAAVSGGYGYNQLVEIWRAANATKSDVMMMWWNPEALYQEFLGTEAEFVQVVLPAPTQECFDARIARASICDEDFDIATSDPLGACDYSAEPVKRLLGEGLYKATFDPEVSDVLQSPAYVTLENFRLTNLALGTIFKYWGERDSQGGFDPRYATCRWVAENIDQLTSYIPESHPRTIEVEDALRDSLFVGAMTLGCIMASIVGFMTIEVQLRQNTKSMFYAGIEFITCVLVGLLLLAVGAIVLVSATNDITCLVSLWLTNIGYAVHLSPLVVRVFAVRRLVRQGKQMQRTHFDVTRLFLGVFVVVSLVCGFCLAWTFLDAPVPTFYYEITNRLTRNGETVVTVSDFCQSESDLWETFSLVWQAALLVPGAVIAYVATGARNDVNDTKALSRVFYSHVFFFVFRMTLYLQREDSNKSDMMAFQSLVISADILFAVCIFVLPKFFANQKEMGNEALPDIFLKTSVLVADVVGFTAWSSAREPVQVFKLLETLYETFDQIADKHAVYKVETVRDCYVAATGIPAPQSNHAEIIAKFAIDVMKKMDYVSKKLELMFGPDTEDLTLRIGIHSGPVTGGFLKGKGARFQLFGDTMTTACLIQTTGQSNRVHLSRETAELLINAGRKKWIQKRNEMVRTEQKGELETWWLTRGIKEMGNFDQPDNAASSAGDTVSEDEDEEILTTQDRWIEWNVDILANVLRQIVAQRATRSSIYTKASGDLEAPSSMPLDEVVEIIELPKFDKRAAKRQRASTIVEIDSEVMDQLREYVTQVARMYNDNPFHNFAHASYVVMAVSKYMNRIVAGSELDLGFDDERLRGSTHEALHDHTYGITSDPLTRFACVFSALIHDIDHPGVPNPQLIKENLRLAGIYQNRSVAEQNSFDLAWELLVDDSFSLLRQTICGDDSELRRFRQLVVNSVMATDLGDRELKDLRNGRWYKAFDGDQEEDSRDAKNRKATIVIEHLIQAADIAHTCQHWGIYRKWNERLFEECYRAYRDGRSETNPADGWYKGELGFYDFYIIPLAKKLRDCGVFGPTSGENLDYAQTNRSKWEKDGERIVADMLKKVEEEYDRKEREGTLLEGTVLGQLGEDDYAVELNDINTLL